MKSNTKEDSFEIFKDLYYKHYQLFFKFVLKFTPDYDIAEDILQESLIKIANKFDTLKDHNKFCSWSFKIIENTYRDWYRKYKRENILYMDDITNIENKLHKTNDDNYDRELADKVHEVLNTLKDQEKRIFVLKHYEKMNYNEIADLLKISNRTVRRRMKSAVIKVTKQLEKFNLNKKGSS